MSFYTGSTVDGSDAREIDGMYVNPKNENEWSNFPYPKQPEERMYDEIMDYADGRYSLNDLKKQIDNKKSKLSRRLRDYVMSHYDSAGNYKIYEDKFVL